MSSLTVVCGAGGALGRAVVAELAARGEEVVAVDRTVPLPDEARAAWGSAGVHELAGDLADERSVERLWSEVERLGEACGLVNLVGGFQAGSLVESEEETYSAMVELNLTTTWHSCRAGAPRLARSGGGAIVNVAARPARSGGQGSAAYAVAKAGVLRLTE
ncbi:MAG: SDR family NAD(P)-dependent oxidoreductase, partial [Candidatus Dormibacteria bacterium]